MIEIIKGHDYSSYFWFLPVVDDLIDADDEFSIEEEDVRHFLMPCISKYDKHFEWYLTDNFFKYGVVKEMIAELEKVITLLKTDSDNTYLDDYKEAFKDGFSYKNDDGPKVLDAHYAEIIDFYNRFIKSLKEMMEKYPYAGKISIMGP